ncbi:carcinoembryonic antigen-related cell adhesion molecule 1-like [Mytilus trossulus]|uniref:carcinoembryonic antigen-related cell adhesion molecule 1-like n=1 Tax=Mytilus trossulus TaxID=6551 RepID=UPI0030079C06
MLCVSQWCLFWCVLFTDGPNQVILSPNRTSFTFDEGDDVPDVTCEADCQPDCCLMWITPTGQVKSNGILRLPKINRTQAGIYLCNASNDVGNMVSDGVTINVRYGPEKVTISPNKTEYVVNEGEHVHDINCSAEYGPSLVVLSPNKTEYVIKEHESLPDISCNATCKPKCVGTWTIDTGEFVSDDILSFPTIKRNQSGSYRCNISNSVSSMISTYVSVIVTYGAEIRDITIDGENFTIPENVEKRLICEIDGVPKPYGRLFHNEKEKLSSINPIVTVMVPLCNDTGNYTCAAENSEGKANQTKELFVLCSPRPVVGLLPKIAVGNDSILEINVIFFSYPQPKISWTFSVNGSNEIVKSNDTIGIYQHVSSIYITDMKTSQYGMYVLQVTNGIPNDFKHTFEVLPQRK